MKVEIITNGDVVTLNIEGRIDTVTAKEFETAAMSVFEQNPVEIIMDCKDLSYVSSSGLRVFLMVQKSATAKKAKLRLINMADAIKNVFSITGFSKILNIE